MMPTARPPISATASRLDELLDDLAGRIQAGEPVDIETFARENPEHASELRRVLPAMQVLAGLPTSGGAVAAGEPLGDLGDYRLIREVGRGGMGVVYEAEQRSLRRRVALKVLPWAAAMDPKQLQRFKNEALAAASLKHDHIVSVYAVGCERGVHYYAMEFVEGQTLAQVIADFRLPIDDCQQPNPGTGPWLSIDNHQSKIENAPTKAVAALSTERTGPKGRTFYRTAADLIAQAADALEHAHSLGIIHRDVKPGNLLLDADGRLYVSDFGLARFGPDAGLTMSGDLLGTLRYMAPEQALTRHGLADHRVDVYGLGCTLYELLTGRPAVGGTDKAEIVRHIAFEEPVAPRKLDKAIPVELETIALKCLAKNPNERYASAGDLSADLRRFLAHQPIKAKPPRLRERAAKWTRRHTALVASVALIATAAALMAAGSIGYVARDRSARLASTEQLVASALAEARAAIETGDLGLAGRQVAKGRGQLRDDGGALPVLSADIDSVQGEVETRQSDIARFQRFVKLADDAQDRMGFGGDFAGDRVGRRALAEFAVLDADDWLSRVQNSTLTAAQKRQVRETAYTAVVSLADHAIRWTRDGRPATVERSLELLRGIEKFHDPTRAFYFVRSECYRRRGSADAADAETKKFEAAPAQTAWDHYLPGHTTQTMGKLDDAIRYYRAALTMQPNHYNALFHLAQCLERKKEYAEALGLFSACLALSPVQGHADVFAHRSFCYRRLNQIEAADADYAAAMAADLDSVDCQRHLAQALAEQGQTADKLAVNRRVLALQPNSIRALVDLAGILSDLGHVEEANDLFRQAIEVDPSASLAHVMFGKALNKQKRYPEAEAAFRRAIKLDPDAAIPQNDLGCLFVRQEKYAQAADAFRRAIGLLPDMFEAHCNLGAVLDRLGRYDEAETEFRRAIELKSDAGAVYNNLGLNLINQRRFPEAAKVLRRALVLSPNSAEVHHNLAGCLRATDDLEGAAAEYVVSIRMDPNIVDAQANFAAVLRELGRFEESVAAFRRAHEIGSKRPNWNQPSAQWIRDGEHLLALESKLPAVLSGQAKPMDAAEQTGFGQVCRYTKRYVAANRFYAAAFVADPRLAADAQSQDTFDAACAAVSAASGQGADADRLDDAERARFRRLALEWLTARLAGKSKLAEQPAARPNVRDGMRVWQVDRNLTGVRNAEALAKLPAAERVAWQKFWADVAALQKLCDVPPMPKPPPKP